MEMYSTSSSTPKIRFSGVRVLHDLARHGGPDGERAEVDAIGSHEARADRAEGVEALAERELAERRLELGPAPRHVVEGAVRADGRARRGAAGPADARSEDERQLALVVGPRLLARDHDGRAVADQGRRVLGEDDRNLGDVELRLLGVVAVVQADADHLAGDDRRQQPDAGEGVLRPVRPLEGLPRLVRGHEPHRAGRAGVADDLTLEPADADVAVRRKAHRARHRPRSRRDVPSVSDTVPPPRFRILYPSRGRRGRASRRRRRTSDPAPPHRPRVPAGLGPRRGRGPLVRAVRALGGRAHRRHGSASLHLRAVLAGARPRGTSPATSTPPSSSTAR